MRAAREGLAQLAAAEEQLAELEARVEQAPQALQRTRQALDEMERVDRQATLEELESLSLEALETRRKSAEEALSASQDTLAEVSSRLLNAQTLPERAQQAIGEAMQRVDERRRQLEELADAEVATDAPGRWQLRIERALAERTLALHQRRLETNSQLRELDQERRDLLERQVARQEARLTMLQAVIDRRRREASEEAIAKAVSEEGEGIVGHPWCARRGRSTAP